MKSDFPSLYQDNLNYKKYANALSKSIIKSDTPFTIWISWEWWYWKTTLMKYISYYLDKKSFAKIKDNILDINFNNDITKFHSDNSIQDNSFNSIFLDTWPFINSRDIWESIFEQVMYELVNIVKENENKFTEVWKFLLKSIWAFIKTVKIKWEIWGIWLDFDPSNFKMDNMFTSDISSSNFQISVKEILNEITTKLWWKLVIFIDDLDRLYPKQALEVILFMKNFLIVEDCIFIIWSDNKVIKEWLEELYGKYWEKENDDWRKKYIEIIKKDFFEKIYQLEFKIPNLLLNEINIYFENFITNTISEDNKKIYLSDEDLADIKTFIQLNVNNFNPRRVKKIFNTYDLLNSIIWDSINNSKINRIILELSIIYVLDFNTFNKIKWYIDFSNDDDNKNLWWFEKTMLNIYIKEKSNIINLILNSFGWKENWLIEINFLLSKLNNNEYWYFIDNKELLEKLIPFLKIDIDIYKSKINELIEYFYNNLNKNISIKEIPKVLLNEYHWSNNDIKEIIKIQINN